MKKLELLTQIQTELQQKMEVQERHFKENLAQLKKEMEKERENCLRKQERILEHKLKVSLHRAGVVPEREFSTDGFSGREGPKLVKIMSPGENLKDL